MAHPYASLDDIGIIGSQDRRDFTNEKINRKIEVLYVRELRAGKTFKNPLSKKEYGFFFDKVKRPHFLNKEKWRKNRRYKKFPPGLLKRILRQVATSIKAKW